MKYKCTKQVDRKTSSLNVVKLFYQPADSLSPCVCVCVCRGAQHTSLEQGSPPQSNTPGTPPSYKLPPLLGNYEGKDDFPLRKTGRRDKRRVCVCVFVCNLSLSI